MEETEPNFWLSIELDSAVCCLAVLSASVVDDATKYSRRSKG
jgi:hypothetical protein